MALGGISSLAQTQGVKGANERVSVAICGLHCGAKKDLGHRNVTLVMVLDAAPWICKEACLLRRRNPSASGDIPDLQGGLVGRRDVHRLFSVNLEVSIPDGNRKVGIVRIPASILDDLEPKARSNSPDSPYPRRVVEASPEEKNGLHSN